MSRRSRAGADTASVRVDDRNLDEDSESDLDDVRVGPRFPVERLIASTQSPPTDAELKHVSPPPFSPNTTLPKSLPSHFTAEQYAELSDGALWYRFGIPTTKVAHAVFEEKDGQLVASQYDLPYDAARKAQNGPDTSNKVIPEPRPLVNIEMIKRFNQVRYRAETPGGTKMWGGRRNLDLKLIDLDAADHAETQMRMTCFSPFTPYKTGSEEPFWGSERKVQMWRDDLSPSEMGEIDAEPAVVKDSSWVRAEPATVKWRAVNTKRNPTQNVVMGNPDQRDVSARDMYEEFYNHFSVDMTKEMRAHFRRSYMADHRAPLWKSAWRGEHLHRIGRGVFPKLGSVPTPQDPQTKDNLGAGPKWANTRMMVLEDTVKWFAKNVPESKVWLKSRFNMVKQTELIDSIDFNVRVQMGSRLVHLSQWIEAFQKSPVWEKSTDIAQTIGVTERLLRGDAPLRQQVVIDSTDETKSEAKKKPVVGGRVHSAFSGFGPSASSSARPRIAEAAPELGGAAAETAKEGKRKVVVSKRRKGPKKKTPLNRMQRIRKQRMRGLGSVKFAAPQAAAEAGAEAAAQAAASAAVAIADLPNVEQGQVTQRGMHALLEALGHGVIVSGRLCGDNVELDTAALTRQGYMPILAVSGPTQQSGHWVMMLRGGDNNYYLYDPLGKHSADTYNAKISAVLPEEDTLISMPISSQADVNRGLCGYWVASMGVRLHGVLNRSSQVDIKRVAQQVTAKMQRELMDGGEQNIHDYLTFIASDIPVVARPAAIGVRQSRQQFELARQKSVQVEATVSATHHTVDEKAVDDAPQARKSTRPPKRRRDSSGMFVKHSTAGRDEDHVEKRSAKAANRVGVSPR